MKYEVLDAEGNVTNVINATEEFMLANYQYYREYFEPQVDIPSYKSEEAIDWRNSELARTDILMATPDYPYRESMAVYRQELRDWPSTPDFPDTRPVAP